MSASTKGPSLSLSYPSLSSFINKAESTTKYDQNILQELQSWYEDFFLHNCKLISLLEKASLFSTFFFLDGVGQNELKQTVVNAILDNWTSWNDYIFQKFSHQLKRNPNRDDLDKSTIKQLQQVPYMPEYALSTAASQTFLSNTELLAEIVATDFLEKKFSIPFKWSCISLIESWRVTLRLKLLLRSGGSILTHNNVPSSRSESPGGEENEDSIEQPTTSNSTTNKPTATILNVLRYRQKIDQLNREKNVKPSPTDIYMVIGELLWIFRPLIYLILLYKHGQKSWKPWLTALGVELTSHYCHFDRKLNKLEKKELSVRKLLLLLFLLKSPFYEAAQQYLAGMKLVSKVHNKIRSLPSVSGLLDMGNKLLNIYRNRYFNLAGSKY